MSRLKTLPQLFVPVRQSNSASRAPGRAPKMEKKEKEATVYVYDVIDSWGFDINTFAVALQEAGDLDRINVRINSPGGNAFDGAAIYNLLRENRAEVVVKVDGQAASAASIIAMAGDQILMGEAAEIMIHNPWVFAMGDSNELIKIANDLKKMDERFANTYAKRTGQSPSDIREMMDAETYLGPDEAVALGFATGKLLDDDEPEDAQATARVDLRGAYQARLSEQRQSSWEKQRQRFQSLKLELASSAGGKIRAVKK